MQLHLLHLLLIYTKLFLVYKFHWINSFSESIYIYMNEGILISINDFNFTRKSSQGNIANKQYFSSIILLLYNINMANIVMNIFFSISLLLKYVIKLYLYPADHVSTNILQAWKQIRI